MTFCWFALFERLSLLTYTTKLWVKVCLVVWRKTRGHTKATTSRNLVAKHKNACEFFATFCVRLMTWYAFQVSSVWCGLSEWKRTKRRAKKKFKVERKTRFFFRYIFILVFFLFPSLSPLQPVCLHSCIHFAFFFVLSVFFLFPFQRASAQKKNNKLLLLSSCRQSRTTKSRPAAYRATSG